MTYYLLLRELHSSSGQKNDHIHFDLSEPIVKDAREYFQVAIETSPTNYLVRCLYAMFLDHCGLVADAEAMFLDTLEIGSEFSYGFVQYALFLVRRGQRASAAAMLKRVKDMKTVVVDPLSGKEILKIFRVYFLGGTFNAVEMTSVATSTELFESVQRVVRAKAEKRNETGLVERKMKIMKLYWVTEEQDGLRYRPLKPEESPWLLNFDSGKICCIPGRPQDDTTITFWEHYYRQVFYLFFFNFSFSIFLFFLIFFLYFLSIFVFFSRAFSLFRISLFFCLRLCYYNHNKLHSKSHQLPHLIK